MKGGRRGRAPVEQGWGRPPSPVLSLQPQPGGSYSSWLCSEYDAPARRGSMAQNKSKNSRLLDGEDPQTIRPQDAQHWIDVYAEMIAFKRHMLDQVIAALEGVSAEARMDLKEDVALLEAQLARYERRSDFWSRQIERLEKSYPVV